jgi:hypothetical protein
MNFGQQEERALCKSESAFTSPRCVPAHPHRGEKGSRDEALFKLFPCERPLSLRPAAIAADPIHQLAARFQRYGTQCKLTTESSAGGSDLPRMGVLKNTAEL